MLQIPSSEYERSHLWRLCGDDIHHIWSLVSCFIEQQMFMRKGVHIFGLGTFTFCQQKLNLGNKHILKQRPVFILSEKLSQCYGFKQLKPQATGVPVVPLNFSALSAEGPFQRDAVERCVRETLLLLLRTAATQPSVSHTFPGIGVLTFRQSRVKMLFCRDFISALDGSGKLSSASASRPESRNSRESERPATFSGATLPRIPAGEPPRKQLQTDEDEDDGGGGGWAEKQRPADRATDLTDKRPANADRGVSRPAGGALSISTVKRSPADESLMCCDHRRAGQELCYVCMQRAQRNRSDERSRAEREQERVLMLREHQKDLQYFQKEETDRQKKREDGQKLAAFNLAAAEAQRRRKAVASSQSDGSYIFAGRACSADRQSQQRAYMQQLMLDAAGRRRTQTEQQRLDRLHLLQLSEEIALERSQQLREKHETSKKYREALEAQTVLRCSEISPRLDARPVFGLMDCSPASLAEQRRRAQNISEELMNTANHRRRETLEKRLNEQKREREMMQRDLKEMLDERMRRYEKLCLLRAACEESWQRSADLKHQRDREELNSRRFGGQTLTEQLGKYERCSRCKRSTANRGESNVFRDTNYVSGARSML
ncbi:coiled-coil domain-containing protein 81-like [Onychostoma macrolepis]|uniref:Coiled-coil domain-containing protein 81 n=1 Tax=Onychostoma macrolepis TaxID=369639 RepID=A0A7J6DKA2_9TELE|nr:coiled-coil domain-containing protein 81-like [Onychostoma macrolepis]XP_058630112.1 coiled-coil domain-containing protein 81-like [Onychostoma macrolepis]XP_058630119.1 coiled-coil domain-containing protein 81-like [Onychostoma macrolepis]KAF4119204.1 hypothetical protein G5714_001255 [Onychostoma macrolepis]